MQLLAPGKWHEIYPHIVLCLSMILFTFFFFWVIGEEMGKYNYYKHRKYCQLWDFLPVLTCDKEQWLCKHRQVCCFGDSCKKWKTETQTGRTNVKISLVRYPWHWFILPGTFISCLTCFLVRLGELTRMGTPPSPPTCQLIRDSSGSSRAPLCLCVDDVHADFHVICVLCIFFESWVKLEFANQSPLSWSCE